MSILNEFINDGNEVGASGIYLIRITVACICGAIIGFERTFRQKEAGIRTHIVVALGASLMMIISKYAFFDVAGYTGISIDASRTAANVITGVSFLGAGTIFLKNQSVRGLTTAAGVWTTSGVGLAIGAGMYIVGISATLLMLVVQIVLHHFEVPGDVAYTNKVSMKVKAADGIKIVKDELSKRGYEYKLTSVEKCGGGIEQINVLLRENANISEELADIAKKDEVISVKIE